MNKLLSYSKLFSTREIPNYFKKIGEKYVEVDHDLTLEDRYKIVMPGNMLRAAETEKRYVELYKGFLSYIFANFEVEKFLHYQFGLECGYRIVPPDHTDGERRKLLNVLDDFIRKWEMGDELRYFSDEENMHEDFLNPSKLECWTKVKWVYEGAISFSKKMHDLLAIPYKSLDYSFTVEQLNALFSKHKVKIRTESHLLAFLNKIDLRESKIIFKGKRNDFCKVWRELKDQGLIENRKYEIAAILCQNFVVEVDFDKTVALSLSATYKALNTPKHAPDKTPKTNKRVADQRKPFKRSNRSSRPSIV